ncbi:MAG: hypothetical protein M1840_001612 [Geoglossum simile]|nr:MAG: hypothetical protein M1840_001612 [Geoglossum simile]
MADNTSPTDSISSPDAVSSLSSITTFSATFARKLVKDYSDSELPSDRTSRVLYAFLDHLPPDSLNVVADDIVSHSKDLRALADHYVSAVLLPVRASGGRTPTAISTRPGDSDDVDNIATEIITQKRDQAKLKIHCLARDNSRCMVTGYYDTGIAFGTLSDIERENTTTADTEAAHIVPFSLATFDERERHSKAVIWDAIYHMFPGIRAFSPNDINDPRNVMTMWAPLHTAFGKFLLCLEPTITSNRYRLKTYPKFSSVYNTHLPSDGFVTFTAHDGRYPLPEEYLLSLHASIGAVLHASGMSEVIDRILRDRDELRTLAADGSTPVRALLTVF